MSSEQLKDTSLIVEKQEFMLNFTGINTGELNTPTLQTAHFIKPTLPTFSELPNPPKTEPLSLSAKPKVSFRGSPPPLQCWLTWAENLRSVHAQTWRKTGVYDAVKGVKYHIVKDVDLLLSLAEKWCPETNTFVFSWGECSITIEDVMVLGGFSGLGDSVISTCSVDPSVEQVKDKLMNWRSEIGVDYKYSVFQEKWAEYFMGRGGELEHAAFFAFWLSRHVFITKSSAVIRPVVFSMAARLSSGVKVALAPAVLGIIYRGLSLLKEKLMHCTECLHDAESLVLLAPFHLVQMWAWERFSSLAPVPRMINDGEPRLARWEGLATCYIESTRLDSELDLAGETFIWRPYGSFVENWSFPSFYDDVGKWVNIDSDDGWEMFACCLRVCQLEGIDLYMEGYHPHRVARQFGFDQDIPCFIPRSNEMLDITYHNLTSRLVKMRKLYVPSRLCQGDVTVRYVDWWKGSGVLHKDDFVQVYSRRKLTSSLPVECNMVENIELDESIEQNRLIVVNEVDKAIVLKQLNLNSTSISYDEALRQFDSWASKAPLQGKNPPFQNRAISPSQVNLVTENVGLELSCPEIMAEDGRTSEYIPMEVNELDGSNIFTDEWKYLEDNYLSSFHVNDLITMNEFLQVSETDKLCPVFPENGTWSDTVEPIFNQVTTSLDCVTDMPGRKEVVKVVESACEDLKKTRKRTLHCASTLCSIPEDVNLTWTIEELPSENRLKVVNEIDHVTMMNIPSCPVDRTFSCESDVAGHLTMPDHEHPKQMNRLSYDAAAMLDDQESGQHVIESLCKELDDRLVLLETEVSILMAAN